MLKSRLDYMAAACFVLCLIVLLTLITCGSDDGKKIWAKATVDSDGDVGSHTSIVLDPSGNVHISYRDNTNKSLKYATNASGSWTSMALDSTADVGKYTSMVLDSGGSLHISYRDMTDNDLKYTTNSAGGWESTTLDDAGWSASVDGQTSVDVDSDDNAHISFHHTYNGLGYATNASGTWESESLDNTGNTGYYSSLAVDSANKVHISYFELTSGNLMYVTNALGFWETEPVDETGSVGCYTSIETDQANKVHISYQSSVAASCHTDGATNYLKYATNVSGSWITNTLADASGTGSQTSIALDEDDYVHIAYYGGPYADLMYIMNATNFTNATDMWKDTRLQGGEYIGMYPSLALDADGKAHISYYHMPKGDLLYMTNK